MKNPERMLGVFNKRNKARLLPRLVKHESALFRSLVRKRFRNGRPPKSFKTVALARASIV